MSEGFEILCLTSVQEQQKLIDKQQAQIEKLREHMQKLEKALKANRRLMKRVIAMEPKK